MLSHLCFILFFKIFYLVFLGKGRENERERNINVWLPLAPPFGDLARNPGMRPDWESNLGPFGSQATLNALSHTSQDCFMLNLLFNSS